MGSQLVGDAWLVEWAYTQGPEGKAARRLLRAQVLTFNRTGHLLALNDEYVRRRILRSGKYGATPRLWVRCLRCSWQANLNDWVAAAEYLPEARKAVLARHYDTARPELTAFLRPCPGEEYLKDLEAIVSLPAERIG